MAFEPAWQAQDSVNTVLAEESSRTFMARVYRWMFVGLATTALTAVGVASNLNAAMFVARFYWPLAILSLVIVFGLSAAARSLPGPVAGVLFLAYSGLVGATLSGIFFVYRLGSISQAFFITAGVFGAMSLYGTITKKDLTSWASFLFMGLIGVVIASVVNIFVHSEGLGFVTSAACVVVFTGLTAYDTQKLRQFHASSGYSSEMSLSVVGALMLYLDFINLFIAILRLFGKRR